VANLNEAGSFPVVEKSAMVAIDPDETNDHLFFEATERDVPGHFQRPSNTIAIMDWIDVLCAQISCL
jgi:hypothetical protein